MVFYTAFNSISVISRQQLTLFMLSFVSPVLGWALKCLAQAPDTPTKKNRGSSAARTHDLDYESNTLPLSHVGPSNLKKMAESSPNKQKIRPISHFPTIFSKDV